MAISRLTLPEEWQDALASRMLLPAEPAYFWARMLDAQVGSVEVARGMEKGIAPLNVQSSGDAVPKFNANAPALAGEPSMPDLIVVQDMAAQPGQTVMFNRLVFADTTYTESSRRATRRTIGTTQVDITGEQVSVTIERYAGPLTAASGSIGPHVIEEFDLKRRPKHDIVERVVQHLRRDRFKFVDTVLAAKACSSSATGTYVYPGDPNDALTADNTAFVTQGDRAMDCETVIRAEQRANSAGVPTFPDGTYVMVLSPRQVRQLKTDTMFQRLAKEVDSMNPLMQRFVAKIGNVRIFECTTNPTATANSTITVQLGVLMGPGALCYATAMPCEIRTDTNTNYGQRIPLVWMADEGWEVLDNTFLFSIRSN